MPVGEQAVHHTAGMVETIFAHFHRKPLSVIERRAVVGQHFRAVAEL